MGMGNLQRMAQQMQQEMARIEGELRDAQVDGSAGGGVVKAVVTGKQELVSIAIDPSTVDPSDVEMLQDLIVAAVNDALTASRRLAEEKMSAVTGGLRIPGLWAELRGLPPDRAGRPADRSVREAALRGAEDGTAAHVPPAPGAGRRGPDAGWRARGESGPSGR